MERIWVEDLFSKCHLEVKGEGSVMLIRLFTKALSKTLMVIIKRLNIGNSKSGR